MAATLSSTVELIQCTWKNSLNIKQSINQSIVFSSYLIRLWFISSLSSEKVNTVKLEFSKKWSKLSFIFHNLYMYIGYNCWTKFSIHWYNFKLTAILSLCLWSLSIATISTADVLKHLIVFYRLTGLFLDQLMRVFFSLLTLDIYLQFYLLSDLSFLLRGRPGSISAGFQGNLWSQHILRLFCPRG